MEKLKLLSIFIGICQCRQGSSDTELLRLPETKCTSRVRERGRRRGRERLRALSKGTHVGLLLYS